jgi:hypothetical protein
MDGACHRSRCVALCRVCRERARREEQARTRWTARAEQRVRNSRHAQGGPLLCSRWAAVGSRWRRRGWGSDEAVTERRGAWGRIGAECMQHAASIVREHVVVAYAPMRGRKRLSRWPAPCGLLKGKKATRQRSESATARALQ